MGIERNLTFNEAGGIAYAVSPEAALAQYATTGCLNQSFYASADLHINTLDLLCKKVAPEIVAKTALFSREQAYMKEVPAALCAWLASKRHHQLLSTIWNRVINNGKMLRKFAKHLRSGIFGRRSFGSQPKRLVASWFNSRTAKEIFMQSTGNDLSFKDIIRLTHPKPPDNIAQSLYRWFLGKDYDELPSIVQEYEDFKEGKKKEVPHVPFEMLTSLKLGCAEWCQIAMRAGWHWLRMNLNSMVRQGVFEVPDMVDMVAERLVDRDAILKAKVFPYQIMIAYLNAGRNVPYKIKEALQDALEIATENVPKLEGDGYILVDVSGSMGMPVTGYRGSTTKVRCVDVAGLLSSSILRKNPSSYIIPFSRDVEQHNINPRDTVLTNAEKLAKLVGGGTNCSAPLVLLNEQNAKGNWVIMISDMESWLDSLNISRYGANLPDGYQTRMMSEWQKYQHRNPDAKLVCLDLQPITTTQAQTRQDILNIGGFSDNVFEIIAKFLCGKMSENYWLKVIDAIKL